MKISIYTLAFTYFILLTSCTKSILDVEDKSIVLAEQYVKDIASGQQYLNGLYVVLARDFYTGLNHAYSEIIADNIKPLNIGSYYLLREYNWEQSTSQTGLQPDQIWQSGYQLARNCSFLIDKSASFNEENQVGIRQLQAEAYTIRALVHFVMVNTFAQSYNYTQDGSHPGIPYVTNYDWTIFVGRGSVANVYESMINDLNKAIKLYTSDKVNTLVMNQMSAKALLARIYLFKEDWQKAKDLSIEVSNVIPIMTNSSIKNMYPDSLYRKGESEALFQLAPSSTTLLSSSYQTLFMGIYFRNPGLQFLATSDIADLLTNAPNDKRKSWIRSGGKGLDTIIKYPSNVIPGFGNGSYLNTSYYHTLFRSSEMVLTVAEASARLNDENTARAYLDMIRQRADSTVVPTSATGIQLLDSIYQERRKEMAFEGLRMYDLLRWKKGVNRTDIAIGGFQTLPYPNEKAIAPIPIVDAANGIPQNSGY